MEAIQSATLVAAKFLDLDKTLGRLKNGKISDIISVPGNPLEDMRVMEKVNLVMKGDVIQKHNVQ